MRLEGYMSEAFDSDVEITKMHSDGNGNYTFTFEVEGDMYMAGMQDISASPYRKNYDGFGIDEPKGPEYVEFGFMSAANGYEPTRKYNHREVFSALRAILERWIDSRSSKNKGIFFSSYSKNKRLYERFAKLICKKTAYKYAGAKDFDGTFTMLIKK